MPSLPLHIAEKLLLLCNGEAIAASKMKHEVTRDLIADGIILQNMQGRTKSSLTLSHPEQLYNYLHNHHGIENLEKYIVACVQEEVKKAELVHASSDSKLRPVRSFKGFLVNSYEPVECTLNGLPLTINPPEGTFVFIHDFERFVPDPGATIVGFENPENFRYIHLQKELFKGLNPLFVCRYPQTQSKDLIRWLQMIPNNYLHSGDYDFAGISIYLHEFKRHLGDKARFLVVDNIEALLSKYGNRERYNVQKKNFDVSAIDEEGLVRLIAVLDKHKKGLDQEGLMEIIPKLE